MELNFDTLDEDLKIDENNLSAEWLGQARHFMKYCLMAASLRHEADVAKESVRVIEAQLRNDAFTRPQELLGVPKATNDRVDAYIANNPALIKAKDAYLKAAYEAEMSNAAVYAFHQKKAALENLVTLAQMSYLPLCKDLKFKPRFGGDTQETRPEKGGVSTNGKRLAFSRKRTIDDDQ